MQTHRLTASHAELTVLCEALRESIAAELLSPSSVATARELLNELDAKLPSAIDHHPAGPAAGRLMAGDEILRLLLTHEDRYSYSALTNEEIAARFDWKPAEVSVRQLLEEFCRGGWLAGRGKGAERRYELTRKGRGRARALADTGQADETEARPTEPEELLDLIYADSTPCAIRFGEDDEHVPGVWHPPTVRAAARLDQETFAALEAALRADGLVGERIHCYGTLTAAGEQFALERWRASQPRHALYRPPRLSRPYRRAREVVALSEDRACPNCGSPVAWLARRRSRRWEELLDRGEADHTCASCDVRRTIYLEPTDKYGRYDPVGDPAICRPRWRFRGGWLHGDALAPLDHHPASAAR
jgi:DNA-binding PadR family transcriptional regulator